jgi:hypothetical protein
LGTATAASLSLPSESWEFLNLKGLVNYASITSPTGAALTTLGQQVFSNPFTATVGTLSYPRSILADGANTTPLVSMSGNTPYWANFQGIKMGDVGMTKRATPFASSSGSRSMEFAFANNFSVDENEEISLKIRCKNFRDLVGFQFPINFDPTKVKFKSVESKSLKSFGFQNMGLTKTDKGKMRFSWISENMEVESLEDDDVLLFVTFVANTHIENVSEVFNLIQGDLPIEFINLEGELTDTPIVIEMEKTVGNMKISPNPFKDLLSLNINSFEDVEAQFTLMDLNGKQLYVSNVFLSKGKNELKFENLSALPDGLMIYSLNSKNQQKKGKVFKIN